jgi:anaphase-promoting complex subunit 4
MSFTELLNKGLSSEVALAAWCPTMDLLALVAINNNLSVHRLNWQRLWSLPLPRPVTAFCWNRDGKMLAVGFEVMFQHPKSPQIRANCSTCPT